MSNEKEVKVVKIEYKNDQNSLEKFMRLIIDYLLDSPLLIKEGGSNEFEK